jgi:hypothetical protein
MKNTSRSRQPPSSALINPDIAPSPCRLAIYVSLTRPHPRLSPCHRSWCNTTFTRLGTTDIRKALLPLKCIRENRHVEVCLSTWQKRQRPYEAVTKAFTETDGTHVTNLTHEVIPLHVGLPRNSKKLGRKVTFKSVGRVEKNVDLVAILSPRHDAPFCRWRCMPGKHEHCIRNLSRKIRRKKTTL